MARGANITVENSFVKGLITEYSPMNFPENAVTEGENCVFHELGRVTRRLGLDYEDDYMIHSLTSTGTTYAEYEWFFVSNEGTRTFVTQQIGSKIYFFSVDSTISVSGNKKSFSIDLMTYASSGTTAAEVSGKPCDFATANGYLIVVHPFCSPIRVAYTLGTDSITVTAISIEIRDHKGVQDNISEVDFRPGTLSTLHAYNLYNQGWYYGTTVSTFRNALGVYPSNADVWWVYKDANEDFDPSLAVKFTLGNTPSAKGHYIYSAFYLDRAAKAGLSGIPIETAGKARPSTVCFYAGRAFYSGVSADGFADKIYFSQIIERDDQFGKCFQSNDPTSETIFDLLESDGGVIGLPQIKNILSMQVVGDALIVLASNGIVSIRGDNNGPFRATNYVIENVSNTGAVNNSSVVNTPNVLFWWNTDGLYQLKKDQIGVYFQVDNISKQTIASLVNQVPDDNLPFVKGAYNKKDQVIQWLFSDEIDITGYEYNKILTLNLPASSFYIHTLNANLGPKVCGIICVQGQALETFIENVTVDGELVFDSSDVVVTVEINQYGTNPGIFKYATSGLILTNNSLEGFTYSQMDDDDYVDWVSYDGDGADYESYFLSGYRIRGELLRKFNSTPVAVLMDDVSSGSALISAVWDYGARSSTVQELYRPSAGTVVIRRVKLRGKGKSLQLKFESTSGKPFSLIGWSTFDTGGSQP